MEKSELLKLVKTPPTDVSQMESLIDVCNFKAIKNYIDYDPTFSIIFNVPNKEFMGIIAAFFTQAAEGTQEIMVKLIDEKVIEIVDRQTLPGKEKLLVHIDKVDPQESCYAIAVPPAYVINLRGEKHE